MTNSKNEVDLKKFFGRVLIGAAVLDVIWAVLVATLYATGIYAVGATAAAPAGATALGTMLGWIVVFFVALFQGAVFELVIGAFIFMGLLLWAFFSERAKPQRQLGLYDLRDAKEAFNRDYGTVLSRYGASANSAGGTSRGGTIFVKCAADQVEALKAELPSTYDEVFSIDVSANS